MAGQRFHQVFLILKLSFKMATSEMAVCCLGFIVNLTHPRVTWETLEEELSGSDWPVSISVRNHFDGYLTQPLVGITVS